MLRGVVAGAVAQRLLVSYPPFPVWMVLVPLMLAGVVLSVWLGTRSRSGRQGLPARSVLIVANGGLILGAAATAISFFATVTPTRGVDVGTRVTPVSLVQDGEVWNLYPYSREGKPLRDVMLYDQSGKPFQLPYEDEGKRLDQVCGSPPPPANAYPLPLKDDSPDYGNPPDATNPDASQPCTSASPSPSPVRPTP